MADEGTPREEPFYIGSTMGVAFISLLVSTAFYLLGFLSPGWTKRAEAGYDFSEGLWEICAARSNFDIPDDGWHVATRIMITLALICLLLSVLLLVDYLFVKRLKHWRHKLILIIPLVLLASLILSVIGLIIYGVKRSPHWSYGMTVIAAMCMFLSGIFMVISFVKANRGL